MSIKSSSGPWANEAQANWSTIVQEHYGSHSHARPKRYLPMASPRQLYSDDGTPRLKTRHQRIPAQRGFTFLEVMIALLLLASASSLLLGMQGASIARTLRDADAQQATLLGRRVMTAIELAGKKAPPAPFGEQGALNALQQFGLPEPTPPEEKAALNRLSVSLQVDEWQLPLPNTQLNPMSKLTLKVLWGPGIDDTFTISYLMSPPDP